MVKHADLLICDSKNIEKYIKEDYQKYTPKTTYIAYGADVQKSTLADDAQVFVDWLSQHDVKQKEYYLIVGRFVPENNYETVIREFMKTDTQRDLVIITNIEKNKFYDQLKAETNFPEDKRIKFVGTVYNQELLKKIREEAYAYIHGHEVGGTNPSLLEALASTDVNLLLDVGFNREVGEDGAVYWDKESVPLSSVIPGIESAGKTTHDMLAHNARSRIRDSYSWKYIVYQYEIILQKDISEEIIV